MGWNPPSPLSVCRFKRWLGKNEGWCLRRVYTPIHTAGKVRGWGILKNRWILVMGGDYFEMGELIPLYELWHSIPITLIYHCIYLEDWVHGYCFVGYWYSRHPHGGPWMTVKVFVIWNLLDCWKALLCRAGKIKHKLVLCACHAPKVALTRTNCVPKIFISSHLYIYPYHKFGSSKVSDK